MIALLLAAAVLAETPAKAAPEAAATPRPDARAKPKSELICQDDTPTGSRLAHRTCVSRAAQAERERVTDYAVDRIMKAPQAIEQGR